jgi:hypothetical protein
MRERAVISSGFALSSYQFGRSRQVELCVPKRSARERQNRASLTIHSYLVKNTILDSKICPKT